jgi:CubicO group peptidase (beta-lactamase class C family)
MHKWLPPALEYIPRWLEFQMRVSQLPGSNLAIACRDKVVLEQAFGVADLDTGAALTPRHRFRVASHTKSFTAAGVMKLREQGRLGLDDPVGRYVEGLNPQVARATIAQLLSHSAGLTRDGSDAGQFLDRRPFVSASELRADLKAAPVVEPNTRFKYSNHGYGLVGLLIEAVTGEPFAAWIKREIIDAAGLEQTHPDMPLPRRVAMASGHTGRLTLGRRLVIPGAYSTEAIAPAGGFISTAHDLALYFGQLSPTAARSILSPSSRREMVRRQWRNPHSSLERYYGLGIACGTLNGWDWFGHSGGLQGYISRTAVVPGQGLSISVLTNAIDGWAGMWVDGVIHILRAFAQNGAPSRRVRDWSGRWWSLWGTVDLVAMGDKVVVAVPGFINPLQDANELEITGRDEGRIALAEGYGSHGEPVRRTRARSGRVEELWLGGSRMVPEKALAEEMQARYGVTGPRPARRRSRSG